MNPIPILSDRMPPQNVELEKALIGAVFLDPEVLHGVIPILQVEDLYRDSHQVIYGVIRGVYSEGKPVDLLTVSEELRRLDLYDQVGGLDTLAEIANAAPHAANAKYHAQIIRQHAVKRQVIAAADLILREGYAGRFTSQEYVEFAEASIFAVRDERGDAESTTEMGEGLQDALARYVRAKRGERFGVLTGIEELDDVTGGLRGGQLLVLAARPSMGKSSMLFQIAQGMASRGVRTLIVTLEMGREEVFDRLMIACSGVESDRVQRPPSLTAEDFRRFGSVVAERSALPIVVDDNSRRTVLDIAATARRMKASGGLGAIVIDYLQLITPSTDSRANRQEQVAEICRCLKSLARDLNVPVIVASQLNRLVEQREDHQPRMSDLRESGAIENDAHGVWLLHRPDYYDKNDQPGVAELIVAKNRNGAVGTIRMAFAKRTMTFGPLDVPLRDFGAAPTASVPDARQRKLYNGDEAIVN